MNRMTVGLIGSMTAVLLVAACTSEADVASYNISKEADQFNVFRHIRFYNTRWDKNVYEVEGLCSLGNNDRAGERTITCKIGPTDYYKHTLGLSPDLSYFSEQIKSTFVDTYHYEVIASPSTLIPDIRVK